MIAKVVETLHFHIRVRRHIPKHLSHQEKQLFLFIERKITRFLLTIYLEASQKYQFPLVLTGHVCRVNITEHEILVSLYFMTNI